MKTAVWLKLSAALAVVTAIGACGKSGEAGSAPGTKLSGEIAIDGSSTVSPIMEAVAEEFGKEQPDVKVTVATSGTGGGFKKFSAGEIDIADASRPIKQEEIDAAKANGIEFIEIPIAFDGLSVVVNPKNTFTETLTVEELKKIWEPDSKVKTWADVRAGLPAEEIKLYGPGTDSGTFDYFTKAIVGEEKASRSDYQA
ncbi:MAG TPA: phosphate ABC transporter substrate-binding protein PstS family protein, partial [Fimbriimonas sp.]